MLTNQKFERFLLLFLHLNENKTIKFINPLSIQENTAIYC